MSRHHGLVSRAVTGLLVSWLAGCGQAAVGTAVDVSLVYDDMLGLDTAEVTLGNRTEAGQIAHRLLLLVSDELDGTDMPIEVWARRAGVRSAYGTATAVPQLGKTVTAEVMLTACTPGCQGAMLTTCTGPMKTCALGCSASGDARCIGPRPSNRVDPALADRLRGTTTIAADTSFDVDTGAVTGGVTRAAGTGVLDGIGYSQLPGDGGGAPLGIFAFHDLTLAAAATVRFTGTRGVVLLVGDAAIIAGTIDVAGGRGARATPGPGGGAGGAAGAAAAGCGPGGAGRRGAAAASVDDSGGGGGGAGTAGARGGDVGTATLGGSGGSGCLPAALDPLRGGSGGGAGSPGLAPATPTGGGGGGALQITALGSLRVTGRINAGGAGGEAGPLVTENAGSGGGGGAGGAILLEAPDLEVTASAILAANGGGGGGASLAGAATAGTPGSDAELGVTPAAGGRGSATGNGGAGGAVGASPVAAPPVSSSTNAGGGGGAVGAIVLRGRALTATGTTSPTAVRLDVQVGM
jgi:hypothetical protein